MNARRTPPGLWKLIIYIAAAHGVAILLLSPQFYCANENSPEALFARGEQAMAEGKHVEAMQYFRQVMDQQPKPPPIYARAAEQHRLADRLARQDAGRKAQESERAETSRPATSGGGESGGDATAGASPTTRPAAGAPGDRAPDDRAPAPDAPFIPPELRR